MRVRIGMHAWGGALVSLSSAVGALVGLRSVVALELPGIRSLLALPALPREGLGISWSAGARWPMEIQAAAIDRLTGLLAALFLAAAGVALLNTLVLLLEAGASRRREIAVRAALGEGPWSVTRLLFTDVRRLLASALVVGLLLGLTWGGALRGAWPGVVTSVGWLGAAGFVLPGVVVAMALSASAYLWTGMSVARGRTLARALLSGERATAAPGEAFQRRMLSALQAGVAGAVALGTVALSLAANRPSVARAHDVATVVATVEIPVQTGASWQGLLDRLGTIPGLEAESLSTPGTLVGLGVRDHATAQCGDCYRGLLYLPFWGAVADHHAVGPDFFRLAGMTVAAGRGITAADGAGAPRVAVVNRTFANTAFERGEPLGRKVHLGAEPDAWYEVVGIVEDDAILGVGGDDLARSAVYVSALQHPLETASLLMAGSDDAVEEALDVAASLGFAPEAPRSVPELRRAAQAPMRWLGGLGLLIGLLTMALAIHGGHATALQITRRRDRELAVRRALGATDTGIIRHVMAGAAGTALGAATVAIFFGALLVALLMKVAGGVRPLGPGTYFGVIVVLVGVGLLGSVQAAREALQVQPGRVVE